MSGSSDVQDHDYIGYYKITEFDMLLAVLLFQVELMIKIQ